MLEINSKPRPLSGRFQLLKNINEKKKLTMKNNDYLNPIRKLNIDTKYKNQEIDKDEEKLETKLYTKTFIETKENNSTINQLTEKTEFLEMLSKQKESDKDALDNIISNEVNRIKNINEKKKKLNEINLIENNYDDLYIWENLFNNSRPLSSYTTLKRRLIKKHKENKKEEEFKSPVILVDLHEDQMNLFFGKNNFIQPENKKRKNKSAYNKNISFNQNLINKNLNINTNIINNLKKNIHSHSNSKSNTIRSKKSSSARNRIMATINSHKSSKKKIFSNYNHIRPMSVYSPRTNTGSFYFSNTFSDYYKEDLKTFSEKMKILKAKIKSNPSHLKKEINLQRNIAYIKEKKLNKIINSNKMVFNKDDLIIAAERKNPIPLLQSIFRTNYPDKEVMKENIKMYYNTMKPMGNSDNSVDYTKNERWKFRELFLELRDREKNKKTELDNNNSLNYNIKKHKNLILKYYNKNDPYIQMLEKMIKHRKENIKNISNLKEENYLNKKKYYNPILDNFAENFHNIDDDELEENIKMKEENNQKEEINVQNEKEIRPKTGYKSVASNANTKMIFYKNIDNKVRRPKTSNIKELNMLDNNYYVPNSNLEYKSKISFPIKTSSNVGNVSYDKINQMLQERHFGLSKIKNDYFMTSTGQVKSKSKKYKYTEEKIVLQKNKKKKDIYDFNDIFVKELKDGKDFGITPRENKIWVEEYFKNFRNKHYSSSNNVHIKNKRKNKIDFLNKYYTQSQYSNDDPELEYVDKSVSSQTNSLNRKIE